MSSSQMQRRFTIASQSAGVLTPWFETAAPGALGVMAYATTTWNAEAPLDDPNFNHIPSLILHGFGYYAIAKGFIQFIEGIAMAKGEEERTKFGPIQGIAGLALMTTAILYEFAEINIVTLSLVLACNDVIKMLIQLVRGWQEKDFTEVQDFSEKQNVSIFEMALLPLIVLASGAGYFALAHGNEKIFSMSLALKGVLFFPAAISQTYTTVAPTHENRTSVYEVCEPL